MANAILAKADVTNVVGQRFAELEFKKQMGVYNLLSPMVEGLSEREDRNMINNVFGKQWKNLAAAGSTVGDAAAQSAMGIYQIPLDLAALNEPLADAFSKYNMLDSFIKGPAINDIKGQLFRGLLEGTGEKGQGSFVMAETLAGLFSSRGKKSNNPILNKIRNDRRK
jgi:hypothetical protein